ncbi:glycerophosphodiester phosphodiesterase [Microbacterium sp. MEC084]|uniref:glycerophosphodiester phosphodiesterase family protein n=1 Tax=unclassified Microbacterium TaxID=2609290 RepID=UPI0007019528|nr:MULTISPECIES: glycerophosphodiester phosphodiesterase family protein [unclassified Microbacterium]KQZ07887.1 glycerophosphodiester phosphodiesterase [Microbacterium sp. Root53]MCD1267266.1 glycerophosphodiester phosphodiesterase [Microbacterium sp. MEC084]
MTHPYLVGTAHPRVLAHRGLVHRGPLHDDEFVVENSFAAIAAAHAAGADYVESDCHLTADGHVVLFHDDTLERVTGDPRPLADVTLRELELLMADRGGLATLAQTLEAFPTTRFNLDVKAPAAAVPLGRMIAEHADRVLVTSFSDARRRAALAAAAPALPATSPGTGTVALLVTAVALRLKPLATRLLRGLDALQIPERRGAVRVLTPRLIAWAHENGVEVHVWTVNDPERMRELVAMGVDGIVTDVADVALETLAR